MSAVRHGYRVDPRTATTGSPAPEGFDVRPAATRDAEELAVLMDSAYRGTIDHHGETLDDARREIAGYLDEPGALEHSFVALSDGCLISAALCSRDGDAGGFIAYVMTAADHKGRGIAAYLVHLSIESMAHSGVSQVTAWITEGNAPSESIFISAGFTITETIRA